METAAHRLWNLAGPLPQVSPPQVKLDDYLAALMIRAEWAAFVQHLRLQWRCVCPSAAPGG